jgi:filamentous hemagglutinin family protein
MTNDDRSAGSAVRFPRIVTRRKPCSIIAVFIMFGAAHAHAAGSLPAGGRFVVGNGTITSPNGTTLNITQNSTNGVMDWTSFSIGTGNTVNIDSGGARNATLARVTGNERSMIDGALNATGRLYLINPQGVVIGKTGVVTTGGTFIASALDTDNDSFMRGTAPLFAGPGKGTVVNLGKISSTGGDVVLISRSLAENDGSIAAPKGETHLAVGDSVQLGSGNTLLTDTSTLPQTFVSANGSHGDAVNKGSIDAVRIALQAADGNVFAMAGNNSALRATGTTSYGGRVWLVADRGTANVDSLVSAKNAAGDGGVVDTSGARLHLDDANVQAREWNISAPQLDVGPLTALTLANNLNGGTSINLSATSNDIHVVSNLGWSGAGNLTVGAAHSVFVNPNVTIASTGSGNLTLRADSAGVNNGGGVVNSGTLDWSKSTGAIAAMYDAGAAYTPGAVRLDPEWSPSPYSGLKTQMSGYQLVNSVSDLAGISNDLAGNYALGRDIGAGSSIYNQIFFDPIGGALQIPFTGQFDGQNHTLSGFYISGAGLGPNGRDVDTGLFSNIGAGGVVRNLNLNYVQATSVSAPVGAIAGRNAGTISHVDVTGSVSAEAPVGATGAGGIVGFNDGMIQQASESAQIRSSGPNGGIAGVNNSTIVQSFGESRITGPVPSLGGGIAGINRGIVTESYAKNSVDTTNAGGLVGDNEGTISQSYAYTDVGSAAGVRNGGGIASINNGTIGTDVYWVASPEQGVHSGTQVSASQRFDTLQALADVKNYAESWDFGPTGTWVMSGIGIPAPTLRWQLSADAP